MANVRYGLSINNLKAMIPQEELTRLQDALVVAARDIFRDQFKEDPKPSDKPVDDQTLVVVPPKPHVVLVLEEGAGLASP